MDKANALRLLREAAPELRRRYGVESALLFGSVARAEGDRLSDVDVAVRFSQERAGDVMALCGVSGYLSEIFGIDVDVVALPVRDAVLSDVIEREAALAFQRPGQARRRYSKSARQDQGLCRRHRRRRRADEG